MGYIQSSNRTTYIKFYISNDRMWIFMEADKSIYKKRSKANIDSIINVRSEKWTEIINTVSRFDTTIKYYCAYEFALGGFSRFSEVDSNFKTLVGKITHDQLIALFTAYTKLSSGHKNFYKMKLEDQLINKLNTIDISNMYNVELRYSIEQNKVKEIFCYINNQKIQHTFSFYRPRNPDGSFR